MLFQVTNIRFDFTMDDEDLTVSDDEKINIQDEVTNTIWEADDEDDLIEEITCATGWCILAIDYVHVLR